MLLGNIGGEQRYEYRAVGDIVNTASRIQGLNPLLGTRVFLFKHPQFGERRITMTITSTPAVLSVDLTRPE